MKEDYFNLNSKLEVKTILQSLAKHTIPTKKFIIAFHLYHMVLF
mgnify:CR=1 FL=1